jgi:hypothetical protein
VRSHLPLFFFDRRHITPPPPCAWAGRPPSAMERLVPRPSPKPPPVTVVACASSTASQRTYPLLKPWPVARIRAAPVSWPPCAAMRRAPPASPPPLSRMRFTPAVRSVIHDWDPARSRSTQLCRRHFPKQPRASSNHTYTLPPTEILTFKSFSLCLDPRAFKFFPDRLWLDLRPRSIRSRSQPARYRSTEPLPSCFAKNPLKFLISQPWPSTYKNPFKQVLFLAFKPLSFSVFPIRRPKPSFCT